MNNFEIGEYVVYQNGDRFELGRIKELCEDGAFVAYSSGDTGAKTRYENLHKLENAYCIEKTTLAQSYFEKK